MTLHLCSVSMFLSVSASFPVSVPISVSVCGSASGLLGERGDSRRIFVCSRLPGARLKWEPPAATGPRDGLNESFLVGAGLGWEDELGQQENDVP